MPRDGKKVRKHLQWAALELYRERGYEETTAAKIAAKAGVTERTFFRHFPDKREVLFDGDAVFTEAVRPRCGMLLKRSAHGILFFRF